MLVLAHEIANISHVPGRSTLKTNIHEFWGVWDILQTGLALMGFSRYCPSSLDLTNFVVRECRGATAEPPQSHRGATAELSRSRAPAISG